MNKNLTMSMSATRIWATVRKELREYRRNRSIIATMALLPVLFVALPIVDIFTLRVAGPSAQEEFLVGKAVAALLPTVAVSYAGFGVFLACVALFAQPAVAAAVFRGPEVLAQVLFTPLLAGWSIWAGIAFSARSSDVRVAQQLGILASLPPLAVTALMSFGVIQPTLALALAVAAALLLLDALGWRIVSLLFDRERLVTGTRT